MEGRKQASEGRHKVNFVPPLRGSRGWYCVPTVSTVGYVLPSLRDFGQDKIRSPHNDQHRNFL